MATRGNTSTRLPIRELFIRQNLTGTIAEQVSPKVYVPKKTGKFYKYDDSNRVLENDDYTARGGANEVDHDYTTADFNINARGLKEAIDGDILDDADSPVKEDLREGSMMNVKDKLILRYEKRLSDNLFNASNFSGKTSALTGSARWNNGASDPASNFKTAKESINQLSSQLCNSLIIGFQAMDGLMFNPSLLALMSDYGFDFKVINQDNLALLLGKYFGVPNFKVFVGSVTYKTVKGGTASYIWGKSALFSYIDPNQATIKGMTLCKTFVLDGGREFETKFYRDPNEDKNIEWAFGKWNYDHQIVSSDCGYLFTTVVD